MISQKVIAWSAASVAVYFGILGIQNGLLIACSISSFLIGGRTGCDRYVSASLLFIAILVLHNSGINGAEHCSRERSRQARTIINKLIVPRYSLQRLDIPTTCPFSPANDKYAAQDVMKRKLGAKWMCSACGKIYAKEDELESHLLESHKGHEIDGCLADYCDILRCQTFFDVDKDPSDCDEESMARLKRKCLDTIRDHCSPTFFNPTERLQVEVMVQASICSFLTCSDYWTVPEEDGSAQHYYYMTYAFAFCVLLIVLAIYFKIASTNIDKSVSIEQILAEADKYERVKPAIIPPDSQNMEIRHRTVTTERQWSEHE